MAILTIEDMAGSVESVVFSSVYESAIDLLAADTPVLIEGRLQKEENTVKIIADKIVSMALAEETWTASIHINLNITQTEPGEPGEAQGHPDEASWLLPGLPASVGPQDIGHRYCGARDHPAQGGRGTLPEVNGISGLQRGGTGLQGRRGFGRQQEGGKRQMATPVSAKDPMATGRRAAARTRRPHGFSGIRGSHLIAHHFVVERITAAARLSFLP